MTIEILGEGCSKCKVMKENVKKAISDLELPTEVTVAMDPERIANLGVLYLPQLVVNGQLTPANIWNSVEELKELFRNANQRS